MAIKFKNKKFRDPKVCEAFDEQDETLTCVFQLKMLRDGYVCVDDSGNWMKRDEAIKEGYGTKEQSFILGIDIDGTGLSEPDWLHVHGCCLTQEIRN